MADSRFLGNSIEELLVALAEGVRDAQGALDQGPLIDAAGRPLATYHIPYLDFTIHVEMTTQTDSGGRPVTKLFAATPTTTTNSAVQSNIAGRLVAVPPGDGLPVPRIAISAGTNIGDAATITITVTNSAGEVLANQPIELNIDPAASATLSAARGASSFALLAGTRLAAAVLTTEADGTAKSRLLIDPKQGKNQVVVVVATLGTVSARGVIPLEVLG